MNDQLAEIRANQAILAGRITALEERLAPDGVVDAVIYCGSERPDYGAPHPCGLPGGHDGEHECLHAHCTVTWQDDPEPVPQWRALVDEHDGTDCTFGPLAEVLGCLHSLAASDHASDTTHLGIGWNIARIVAVCEAQVGDGWQADPDGIVLERVVQWLLGPLSRNDWRVLGNRAAAWLRDLTDGAA